MVGPLANRFAALFQHAGSTANCGEYRISSHGRHAVVGSDTSQDRPSETFSSSRSLKQDSECASCSQDGLETGASPTGHSHWRSTEVPNILHTSILRYARTWAAISSKPRRSGVRLGCAELPREQRRSNGRKIET